METGWSSKETAWGGAVKRSSVGFSRLSVESIHEKIFSEIGLGPSMKFYNLNRLRRNLGANFALPRLRSPEMSTPKGIEPRMIAEMFTRHPASVGETYGEHMLVASSFGLKLLLAALACFVHALLPFLFERTGSTAMRGKNAANS